MPMLYLPPISYMALICAAGEVQIEASENYIKSTYRNRCEIPGANGIIALSIPLKGGRDHHQLYSEAEIAYTDHWQHRHLMSILSCYGSSPFYEHYIGYFEPFYIRQYDNLYELNNELLMLLIRLMKLDVKINYTDIYEQSPDSKTDLRHAFKPDKQVSDLTVKQKEWRLREAPYIQVFGANNMQLSSLDLLFNTGPESKAILSQMVEIS